MALSRDTGGTTSPQASTSYPRCEEARPFPLMAPSPPPFGRPASVSPTPSREDSCERDASANFNDRNSNELSPASVSTVHPGDGGIFNFNSNEGGPVRLTNLTPISPTNDDVYNSAELRSNPQPPISNSILQVLSPTRPPVGGYPFLLTNHGPPIFTMQENEKYRKLMIKKQKRVSKKEKNVLNVFKAEDVEGHKGEEDLNSVLQSMGEKVVEEKKSKAKKPRDKIEKTKLEKKERSRNSVEKDMGDQDEEEEEERIEEKENLKLVSNKGFRNKFVDDELAAFKNNFNFYSPEPGPLARHKSRECLTGSVESLPGLNNSPQMSFTKVTNKKHRSKRSKEETGKPPPVSSSIPVSDSRRSGYALRSRDTHTGTVVPREQAGSPTESDASQGELNQSTGTVRPVVEKQLSLESENFPKLVKDDFPALPGGKGTSEVSSKTVLPSAWARVVTKVSDNIVTIESCVAKEDVTNQVIVTDVSNNELESEGRDSDHDETTGADKACDHLAVIDCDVPSDSSDHVSKSDCEKDTSDVSDVKDSGDIEESETAVDIYVDLNSSVSEDKDLEKNIKFVTDTEAIEVITSEDEFNRRKANNSAPVVIFSENDQDWTSSEFTFGFDINEDLVANSSTVTPIENNSVMSPHRQPQQMWTMPGPMAPLTPIDTVDGAILSFGGPDTMRPVIVGVPVGVPVPVSVGGHLPNNLPPLPFYSQFANGTVLPPPFPAYGMSFTHHLPTQGAVIHHQFHEDESELDVEIEKGGDHDQNVEDHTISPESGISSASPLSWQPDSSPSLPAPGSYPHPRGEVCDAPAPLPLVSQVSQSLSSWQGHCSVHSESTNSSRSSPAPGWATQMEREDERKDSDLVGQDSEKTNDSGLASENSNSLLEKDLKQKEAEKFNLGEIVNFISSSWSSVSKDSSVQVFSAASHGQNQTNVLA